jgi:hypothetical protein
MRASGLQVMRTNRLGAQFSRAAIWVSSLAAFFAYRLPPLAAACRCRGTDRCTSGRGVAIQLYRADPGLDHRLRV